MIPPRLHQRLDDHRRHRVALPGEHLVQNVGTGQIARRYDSPSGQR